MNMINDLLSEKATKEDSYLQGQMNPPSPLLAYIAQNYALKKVPFVGTVISDAELINEVLRSRDKFELVKSNSIKGVVKTVTLNYGMHNNLTAEELVRVTTVIDSMLSNLGKNVANNITPILDEIAEGLNNPAGINIVPLADRLAYSMMWSLFGLDESHKDSDTFFSFAINRFRNFAANIHQKDAAQLYSLDFLTEIFNRSHENKESFVRLMSSKGFSKEEAADIGSSLFIAGAEMTASTLPRMLAFLVKTGHTEFLAENPAFVMPALKEGMRVIAPTPVTVYVAKQATRLNDIPIKKGEKLILSAIEASNRFGEFNPEVAVPSSIEEMWSLIGPHQKFGVSISLYTAKPLVKSMIAKHPRLTVLSQSSEDKDSMGRYKELVIGTEQLP